MTTEHLSFPAPRAQSQPCRARPIILSGPMVSAALEGRKTNTRRLVTPAPTHSTSATGPMWGQESMCGFFAEHVFGACMAKMVACPYGRPGDRLWVRETWRAWERDEDCLDHICYRADGAKIPIPNSKAAADFVVGRFSRWQSPRFMPRWASRLLLEVTEVRVQRLQDISEEDAKAEGLSCLTKDGGRVYKFGIPDRDGWPGSDDHGWPWQQWHVKPRIAFGVLWNAINGKRASWESNPWVWAISFRRVKP